MHPKPHLKDKARWLFFQTDKTQTEIADEVGVNRRTIYLWIKHGDWKKIKAAVTQSPQILVQDMYSQMQEINTMIAQRGLGQRYPTPDEAETLRKLTMSIKAINIRPLGDVVRILEELTRHIAADDRDLARLVIAYADQLIKQKQQGITFLPGDDELEDEVPGPEKSLHHEVIKNGIPGDTNEITMSSKCDKDGIANEIQCDNDAIQRDKPAPPPTPCQSTISGPPSRRYRSWEKNSGAHGRPV